jgi:hypothetical protein
MGIVVSYQFSAGKNKKKVEEWKSRKVEQKRRDLLEASCWRNGVCGTRGGRAILRWPVCGKQSE